MMFAIKVVVDLMRPDVNSESQICMVLGSIAVWNIDPRYKMSFEMVRGHI